MNIRSLDNLDKEIYNVIKEEELIMKNGTEVINDILSNQESFDSWHESWGDAWTDSHRG